MNRRFLPITILVIIGVLFGANILAQRSDPGSPEHYQSQAGGASTAIDEVVKFDLEIELTNDRELEMYYWRDREGKARANLEHWDDRDRDEESARREIENLITNLPPLTTKEPLTIIQATLDQLEISQDELEEFELEYKLADGFTNKIDLEVNDVDDDDDDDDD